MELRARLREKMRELKVPLEVPYRRVVCDYLNLVFGNGDASKQYWKEDVTRLLRSHFNFTDKSFEIFTLFIKDQVQEGLILQDLDGEGGTAEFSAAIVLNIFHKRKMPENIFNGRWLLFDRLRKLTGLLVSEHAISRFYGDAQWNPNAALEQLDLLEIGERVKHTNVVAYAEGSFYQYKAIEIQQANFKMDMLWQAIESFEEALSSNPNDPNGLLSCALTYYHYILHENRNKAEEKKRAEGDIYTEVSLDNVMLSPKDIQVHEQKYNND
tara:strand:- start:157 stop:963 length:807 start_codon:yes stop_codon:yes gene_type:complete